MVVSRIPCLFSESINLNLVDLPATCMTFQHNYYIYLQYFHIVNSIYFNMFKKYPKRMVILN
jgi:hypothetical protein